MARLFIVLQLIFLPLAARCWDIAVVTTEELDSDVTIGQVEFFSDDNNGSILARVLKPLADIRALEYDLNHEQLFLSDGTDKNYSIFTLNLRGNNLPTPLIKKTGNETVRDIAYDAITDTIYWTGENAIYWYNKNMKNNKGEILIQLDKGDSPHGIAIDSCRRFLYWTNRYHLRPSIERSLLDGTKREIIVKEGLYRPMGLAVDQSAGKLYWGNDKEGIYYDIRRADLDGNNVEILRTSTHHEPVYLAVGPNGIYWSDSVNNAVWKMPKKISKKVEPFKMYQYSNGRTPLGIVVRSEDKSCNSEHSTTKLPDSREGIMSDGPLVVSESSVQDTSDYCLNGGVFILGKGATPECHCLPGYSGKRCEVNMCHNFCLNGGECRVEGGGQPRCVCPQGVEGSRCERNVCSDYCLNGGVCNINKEGNPICECKEQYSGSRCEEDTDVQRLCKLYCEQFGQVYVPVDGGVTPVCVCPTTTGTGQYDILDSNSSRDFVTSSGLTQSCPNSRLSDWMSIVLGGVCIILTIISGVLARKVLHLRKRPRIKKRIIVNKNVTPLTSRPPQPEQCEITIENCCNMNICETPCFEPQLRTPDSSRREEKKTLLDSMEEPSTSPPCQEDLY